MKLVIPDQLARSSRPGYPSKSVPAATVVETVDAWKSQNIRSILCLLDDRQLAYYESLPGGLLEYYRSAGFEVGHVPIKDHKSPPLDDTEMKTALKTYEGLPKPVLVHCSAGIDRTGALVQAIQ